MKNYLKNLFKTFIIILISVLLIIGGFIVYASISWPSAPSGETSGGKFIEYFNKIVVGDNITATGTVKLALETKTLININCPDGQVLQGFKPDGSTTCVTVGTESATPQTCTSFTYTDWGVCQSNNTQTRTVVSKVPSGCTGGAPVTSQSCTYVSYYPGCDTADITLSNGQVWAACNVGSSVAGFTTVSYGNNYTQNDSFSICASGYLLPSQNDWINAKNSYPNETFGDLNNLPTKIKLPVGGYYYDNNYYNAGVSGGYWISSSGFYQTVWSDGSTYGGPTGFADRLKFSVRCIKNSPVNGLCSTSEGQCLTGTSTGYTAGSCGSSTWSCLGAYGGNNVNCNISKPPCFPGCDTADITLSNGQVWAACNVGSSVAGIGEDSYGNYYDLYTAISMCTSASGYRLPSQNDWISAINLYPDQTYGNENNLPNKLKLPKAGVGTNTSIPGYEGKGHNGFYKSSTKNPGDTYTYYILDFGSIWVKADRFTYSSYVIEESVRCIKN